MSAKPDPENGESEKTEQEKVDKENEENKTTEAKTDTPKKDLKKRKDKNDPLRFQGAGVNFKAKLIGVKEVAEARGDKMCQDAIQHQKASVLVAKEHKHRIMVNVSLDGIKILDEKTGSILHHHAVHKISFISRDVTDARAFGYVYGNPDGKHDFFGIKTAAAAEGLVLTLRDLFQVVFEMKKKEVEEAKQKQEEEVKPGEEKKEEEQPQEVRTITLQDQAQTQPEPASESGGNLVDLENDLRSLSQGIKQMTEFGNDAWGATPAPAGQAPATNGFGAFPPQQSDPFLVNQQMGQQQMAAPPVPGRNFGAPAADPFSTNILGLTTESDDSDFPVYATVQKNKPAPASNPFGGQQAGGFNGAFGAQQPGFGAPQPGFGAPQPGFGAPQPGFGAPQQQMFQPQQSQQAFGAPQPGGFGAPQPGFGGGFGGGMAAPPAAAPAPSNPFAGPDPLVPVNNNPQAQQEQPKAKDPFADLTSLSGGNPDAKIAPKKEDFFPKPPQKTLAQISGQNQPAQPAPVNDPFGGVSTGRDKDAFAQQSAVISTQVEDPFNTTVVNTSPKRGPFDTTALKPQPYDSPPTTRANPNTFPTTFESPINENFTLPSPQAPPPPLPRQGTVDLDDAPAPPPRPGSSTGSGTRPGSSAGMWQTFSPEGPAPGLPARPHSATSTASGLSRESGTPPPGWNPSTATRPRPLTPGGSSMASAASPSLTRHQVTADRYSPVAMLQQQQDLRASPAFAAAAQQPQQRSSPAPGGGGQWDPFGTSPFTSGW